MAYKICPRSSVPVCLLDRVVSADIISIKAQLPKGLNPFWSQTGLLSGQIAHRPWFGAFVPQVRIEELGHLRAAGYPSTKVGIGQLHEVPLLQLPCPMSIAAASMVSFSTTHSPHHQYHCYVHRKKGACNFERGDT